LAFEQHESHLTHDAPGAFPGVQQTRDLPHGEDAKQKPIDLHGSHLTLPHIAVEPLSRCCRPEAKRRDFFVTESFARFRWAEATGGARATAVASPSAHAPIDLRRCTQAE